MISISLWSGPLKWWFYEWLLFGRAPALLVHFSNLDADDD